MYASLRRYQGARPLIDALDRRAGEVRELLGSVPGFVAYYGMRDGDALTTVSICGDRAGCDETVRRAAEWVRTQLPAGSVPTPEVTTAEVFLDFAAQPPAPAGAFAPRSGGMHG